MIVCNTLEWISFTAEKMQLCLTVQLYGFEQQSGVERKSDAWKFAIRYWLHRATGVDILCTTIKLDVYTTLLSRVTADKRRFSGWSLLRILRCPRFC